MANYRPPQLSYSLLKRLGSLAILALMLWGGGVGCAVCCAGTREAESCAYTKDDSIYTVAEETAPSGDHSCCARAESPMEEVPGASLSRTPSVRPCCFHAAGFSVKAAFPQPLQDGFALPKQADKLIECDYWTLVPQAYDLFKPPDKGGTYLRLGVLLI
jgi:hypothetical protein